MTLRAPPWLETATGGRQPPVRAPGLGARGGALRSLSDESLSDQGLLDGHSDTVLPNGGVPLVRAVDKFRTRQKSKGANAP